MLIFWSIIFIISMIALVKGADYFVESSEKIGLALGLSPFIVGVTIVGLGTSCPELVSALAATFRGVTEIVVANAVGSNIVNILLIVGLSALVSGHYLKIRKSLIDLDLPLLAISTVLVFGVLWDRQVNFSEGVILAVAFAIYLLYTIVHRSDQEEFGGPEEGIQEVIPSRLERRRKKLFRKKAEIVPKKKLESRDFIFLTFGMAALILGAKYTIEAVVKLSEALEISPALISIIAIALGTSLPELMVSARAAWQKKYEVALGNIFGSNIFNGLLVIGLPALIKDLEIDQQTFTLGIPVFLVATLLFVISGISRRIHVWEGAMYLMVYVLFIAKLLNLF